MREFLREERSYRISAWLPVFTSLRLPRDMVSIMHSHQKVSTHGEPRRRESRKSDSKRVCSLREKNGIPQCEEACRRRVASENKAERSKETRAKKGGPAARDTLPKMLPRWKHKSCVPDPTPARRVEADSCQRAQVETGMFNIARVFTYVCMRVVDALRPVD